MRKNKVGHLVGDTKSMVIFLNENVIIWFTCFKILIGDRGKYFLQTFPYQTLKTRLYHG